MRILLLIDDLSRMEPLWHLLAHEGHYIVAVDSRAEALDEIVTGEFDYLFIRRCHTDECHVVADRFRSKNPSGLIRRYENIDELISARGELRTANRLNARSLDLAISLLESSDQYKDQKVIHTSELVSMLCYRLTINDTERTVIESSAYLYDLARNLIGKPGSSAWVSWLDQAMLSDKGISGSEKSVLNILRRIGHRIVMPQSDQLPLVEFGASILNLVDHTLNAFPELNKTAINKIDRIRASLRSQVGRLYLENLIEPFLMMLREEVLVDEELDRQYRISLLSRSQEDNLLLIPSLTNLNFMVRSTATVDSLCEDLHRFNPDLLLIEQPGEAAKVAELLNELAGHGVQARDIPTFLIVDHRSADETGTWLRMGIEDVHPSDADPDLLLVKLVRTRDRLELQAKHRLSVLQDMGTHGSLEDMNVIDLLQAMGVSGKTCRISISAAGKQLSAYLKTGQLIFAECDGMTGAEAVHIAIPWKSGIWSVDPLGVNDLPEPNNEKTIDTILLEGCQLLDEKVQPTPLG